MALPVYESKEVSTKKTNAKSNTSNTSFADNSV